MDGFKYNAKGETYCLKDHFILPAKIYQNLFEHQKLGLIWLYGLYKAKHGGILGDDMGLGKTVQVATFCKGLFDGSHIKRVLIVMPSTL